MEMNDKPKTPGIAPAQKGALSVLQFEPRYPENLLTETVERVQAAAREVANYHAPTPDQADRHKNLSDALTYFLEALVANCPSGPERSTAISRAREAKMWASAGVALEGK